MNILIYMPGMYYCDPGFYLEIIQRHKNINDSIYILRCNGELHPICRINQQAACFKNLDTSCEHCNKLFSDIVKVTNISPENVYYTNNKVEDYITFDDLTSTDDLYKVYHSNYDVGMAIINTIACGLNIYNPSINDYRNVFVDIAEVSISLYEKTIELIRNLDINKVYMFNGRIAINRPVLRASEKCNVEFICLEYAVQQNKFLECVNAYPQNPQIYNSMYSQLKKHYDDARGHLFFNQQKNVKTNVFLKNMEMGQLPYNFDTRKKNIAIYLTSLTEISAIGEFSSDLIPDFNTCIPIAAIAEMLSKCPEYHLYIRSHPNMISGEHPQQMKDLAILDKIHYPNLTIIWPSDPFDSYTLMQHADKVLTFGSTVGIEATYYGKPSILIGKSFYMWTDGVYIPQKFSEVLSLLKTRELHPKPQEEALKYGLALYEGGTPFQFFDPINQTFLGNSLHPLSLKSKIKGKIIKGINKLLGRTSERVQEIDKLTKQIEQISNKQKTIEALSSITENDLTLFRTKVKLYLTEQ